jgi:predicted membrane metal-binding protein
MSTNDPIESHRKVIRGSDRSFGLVFGIVFAVIAVWPLIHGGPVRWWALALACVFAGLAVLAPRLLGPLNRLWFRFGLLLHHIVNPVVMILLYVTAIVPISLIMRACGKDLLRLGRDRQASTYWISREPSGPSTGSMSKQF